jgi:hypothetical protein
MKYLVYNVLLLQLLMSGCNITGDKNKVPGVVVDHIPASEKIYIGSPGICILPDGSYVASHDLFGPAST